MIPYLPVGPVATGGACVALPACASLGGAVGLGGGGLGGGVLGGAGQAAAGAVLAALGSAVTGAARAALSGVGTALAGSPTAALHQPWYAAALGPVAGVAAALLLPLLLAATLGAVVRQDPGRLARVWLVALPLAATASALVLPLAWLASDAADQMSAAVAPTAPQIGAAVDRILPSAGAVGDGALAAILGAVALAGALALWLELVVRNAAVEVVVLFLPVALAALLWPATAGVARRAVEVLGTLLLSKFVIAATLSLGLAAVAAGGGGGAGDLTGLAILLLAAFAPVAMLRLVPVVEAAAIAHLEGRARQPLRVATASAAQAGRWVPAAGAVLGVGPSAEERAGASTPPGGGAASSTADWIDLAPGQEIPGFGDWDAIGRDRPGGEGGG